MDVKVFQFNGCEKCFNESLLLKEGAKYKVEYVSDPKNWKGKKADISVITGYLLPSDLEHLQNIKNNSDKVIAYGDCTATGGVFALANQKGHDVTPLVNLIEDSKSVYGCLGEIEELELTIEGKEVPKLKSLCQVCSRKATCDYLESINRQIELEDSETCFNDLGFLCSGFTASECKEKCVDYNTPCRGCKPSIDRSGIRMMAMFGTLAGNIEIATEHNANGATDKLADEDDDLTDSLPDIVGNFFRFTLPTSGLPKGRIPSSGTLLEDVFKGRLIEEIPLISGLLGGAKSISLILKFIEPYEKANQIEVSGQTKKYREELLQLEKELQDAIVKEDASTYKEITDKIRSIAGNMNLSNIFFGGFKSIIDPNDDFNEYKTHIFEVVGGTYKNGSVEYSIDSEGIIKEIKISEGL
jgi:coenzyme F420-reducing hydrogenase gamma subunit